MTRRYDRLDKIGVDARDDFAGEDYIVERARVLGCSFLAASYDLGRDVQAVAKDVGVDGETLLFDGIVV